MAQIVKSNKKDELINIDNEKKEQKVKEKKVVKHDDINIDSNTKKSLWTRFMIFCHGVKSEVVKVRWTSKKDMLKYSIATIVFILFCSLFFYSIDFIFALVQSLVKKG